MERYETLGPAGEGSYGAVLKCRRRDSGRLVAIKKFTDSDSEEAVKKMAVREVKLLRRLRHDNLVKLLEVWRRRRRWYLVFEFVDRTLLDELDRNPDGLDADTGRRYLFQILRAAAFCHEQQVIHRDIKPENILVSSRGVVKLCDFGFARGTVTAGDSSVLTGYVATRWYRAPELLVGDGAYGKPVDVWAIGCVMVEMFTAHPLFPGDSDLDQIHRIVHVLGGLTGRHQDLFDGNPLFYGVRLPQGPGSISLEQRFPGIGAVALDVVQSCLQMDPERRPKCSELLEHRLFTHDSFQSRFLDELSVMIQTDRRENATLPKITGAQRQDRGMEVGSGRKDLDEKVAKNDDKRKKKGEEKVEKSKRKEETKVSKAPQRNSEPAKQLQMFGAKPMMMKSKGGKAPEPPKSAKTPTAVSSGATVKASTLKDPREDKPKPGRGSLPEPENEPLKDKETKDSRVLHSMCPETTASNEGKAEPKPWRPPASEPTAEFKSLTFTKEAKMSKSPNIWDQNKESPDVCSEPPAAGTDTRCNDCVEDVVLATPETSLPRNLESDRRPSVLFSNPKLIKTTFDRCLKLPLPNFKPVRTNLNPKICPPESLSKTQAGNLLGQSNICLETSRKRWLSITKPADETDLPNKPPKGRPTDRDNKATKTKISSCKVPKDRGIWEGRGRLENMQTRTQVPLSGGEYRQDPETSPPLAVQRPKAIPESRTTSRLTKVPGRDALADGAFLKTPKASNKENRESLGVCSATTKTSVHPASKVPKSSNNEQKNIRKCGIILKSLKPQIPKYLIRQSKADLSRRITTKSVTGAKGRCETPGGHVEGTRSSFTLSKKDHVDHHGFALRENAAPLPQSSSTSLVPSITDTPESILHLTASRHHPGTRSLRVRDKRHRRSSLSGHIIGSFAQKATERSVTCEPTYPSALQSEAPFLDPKTLDVTRAERLRR